MKTIYSVLTGAFFAITPGFAKDLEVKHAEVRGDYLFLESARQPGLITIVGKTETVVTSKAEGHTTLGAPIRSWVVSTRWIDDPDALRLALAQATEAPHYQVYGPRPLLQ